MSGPVVAVYDPSRFPFTLAAVHACADADAAAELVAVLRPQYPGALVTVVYPGRDAHPAGKARP